MKQSKSGFTSMDLTSNASGGQSGQASNIIQQINDINAKLTSLGAQRAALKADNDAIDAKFRQVGTQSCMRNGKSYGGWISGEGVYWCAPDSQASRDAATAETARNNQQITNIDAQVKSLNNQLDQLNTSLPEVAKSDPAVIQALAQAQSSADAAKQKTTMKKTWLYVGAAVVLLATIGFIVVKIEKNK